MSDGDELPDFTPDFPKPALESMPVLLPAAEK